MSKLPAIPAARNPLGAALVYYGLMRGSLERHFNAVYLKALAPLPTTVGGPVIFYLNHPSWWDGHMCALIERVVFKSQIEGYLMMAEPQLRRYRFFSWMGAFSVNRHDPADALNSVAYVAALLREDPRRCCFIFPQGNITPNDRRPLKTYPGVARIAQGVGAVTLCPVALRYEQRGEERPDAFVRLGPSTRVDGVDDVVELSRQVAERLTAAADALRDEVIGEQLDDYQLLLRGRTGVNRVFDRYLQLARKVVARR